MPQVLAQDLDLARRGRGTRRRERSAVVGIGHPQPPGAPELVEIDGGASASRNNVSSSANSAGSVKPMAPARRRKNSVLLQASPSGAIAASFQPIQRWPHAGTTSVFSIWVVAGSTMSA